MSELVDAGCVHSRKALNVGSRVVNGYSSSGNLLMLPISALLYPLLYRLIAPLLRKFRAYTIRRKWAAAACYVVNTIGGVRMIISF